MATISPTSTRTMDSKSPPKVTTPEPVFRNAPSPHASELGISTPNELESIPPHDLTPIRSTSSTRLSSVGVAETLKSPPGNLYRFINACSICLVLGLNDSAPGALLPYIESHYNIKYGVVSLIFVSYAIGFVSAAPFTKVLETKLGRAWFLFLAQALVVCEYIMISVRPPFAVVVLAFYISGLGSAWTLSVNNVFVSGLKKGTSWLGVFHGCYGVGGILGPLIATALVSTGKQWSDFYFITLGLSVLNAIGAYFTSRGYEREKTTSPRRQSGDGHSSRVRTLLKTIGNRTTLLGASFIFAYQGVEVALSGWILSFLLTSRPHLPSQSTSLGYVTSGYWGGITLGRFVLSHFMQPFGERLAVVILIIGSAIFQIVVWTVPNILGDAVAVSFVGLLLGPIYAFAITIFTRLQSREELVSALSFISAMGSSGGAVAPFLTGIISQKTGIWVVNPIALGLLGAMGLTWLFLPRVPKRRE